MDGLSTKHTEDTYPYPAGNDCVRWLTPKISGLSFSQQRRRMAKAFGLGCCTFISHIHRLPMTSLSEIVPAGVVTGDDLINLLKHARENGYAIPAVNCTR